VGGVILYFLGRGEQHFFYGFAVLFLAVHLIAVTADAVSGKVKSVHAFVLLYLAYSLQTVVQLLALVMYIPMILLSLFGPFALIGGLIAVGGLTIYFVEEVVGYDIRGYSFGDNRVEYLIALLLISLLVLAVRAVLARYKPEDKVLDLILHGLDPLIGFSRELEDKA
jgi:hypothetical protein